MTIHTMVSSNNISCNNNDSTASTNCSDANTNHTPSLRTKLTLKERRRIKQRFRCIPWYNHDEFNHVGYSLSLAAQLFSQPSPSLPTSPSPSRQHQEKDQEDYGNYENYGNDQQYSHLPNYHEISYAIQRVSIVWRKRNLNSNSRLPHYIDITASLAESLLNDAVYSMSMNHDGSSYNNGSTVNTSSSMALRLSYASTIIRGVNGIADSIARNRAVQIADASSSSSSSSNQQSLSVSNLCSKMGLPSWIVDIRHDASHQELPSLTMLRLGAITLLQFYIDKYWLMYSLSSKSLHWKEKGLEYLMQWKQSCSVSNTTNNNDSGSALNNESEIEKDDDDDDNNTAKDENNKQEDDNSDDNNNESATMYGRYSIFMEPKKDKKKKLKKISTCATSTTKLSTKKKDKKKSQSKEEKSQQQNHEIRNRELTVRHIANFISEIPMDIAYDLLLSYFIWGGIGDAPPRRGILIPGSIKSFPQNIDGVRKLRQKYGHTLIHICEIWPGFISSMVINLVDAILILERSGREDDNGNGMEAMSTVKVNNATKVDYDDDVLSKKIPNKNSACKEDTDEDDDENDDHIALSTNIDHTASTATATAAGLGRKMYFLFSWVQYLLSNEFYYHLEWIDESTKSSIDTATKKKKKKKRKNDNYTPWSDEQLVLLESKVSMDILKDANIPLNSLYERCINTKGCETVGKIISLFGSYILDDQRDVDNETNDNMKKRKSDLEDHLKPKKQRQETKVTKKHVSDQNMLSLEDMESMIMSVDDDESNSRCDSVAQFKIDNLNHSEVIPWTQCSSWDACAIGSLPGHVS